MELDVVMPQKVFAKSVSVHVKVTDQGNYSLRNHLDKEIACLESDYVPGFFPGEHYGDYLILDIDLETGKVLNWKAPSPSDVVKAFKLGRDDE